MIDSWSSRGSAWPPRSRNAETLGSRRAGDKIVRVDARAARIGHNEALFREVNERIERVSEALQVTTERIAILCECGDESCAEKIEVALPEYERVRADSELFFVRCGHEQPDVERIVEQHEDYDVVRKEPGPAAELARDLDDRNK
jgi:hypothetical protein